MKTENLIFICIITINTVISLIYLICGLLNGEKNQWDKKYYLMNSFLIFICPIIGIIYIILSKLLHKIFFHKEVDLSDVIFNKEKIKQIERTNLMQEINYASIEEAIAVSDHKNQRELMLNVLRNDVSQTIGSISLALNSDDSEVSHYAATAMRDELGNYRNIILTLKNNINKEEEIFQKKNECKKLIEEIYPILQQKVFPVMEQKDYVELMYETFNLLYEADASYVKKDYYIWVISELIEINENEKALEICKKAEKTLNVDLVTYKCYLKYYYNKKDSNNFLSTLDKLKKANISIDNDMLELIRLFN